MPTRIWKKPTESASPKCRFFIPDSTIEAMIGSSGGSPRACACAAIQAAICSCGALSPGYGGIPPGAPLNAAAAASATAGAGAGGAAAAAAFGGSTAFRKASEDDFARAFEAASAVTACMNACELRTGLGGAAAAASAAGAAPGTAAPGTAAAAATGDAGVAATSAGGVKLEPIGSLKPMC